MSRNSTTKPIQMRRPMPWDGAGGGGGGGGIGGDLYSQSMPAPRAPIIGSMPAPMHMPDTTVKMPELDLPPSVEVRQSPLASLSRYAASCPAPSMMLAAAAARGANFRDDTNLR